MAFINKDVLKRMRHNTEPKFENGGFVNEQVLKDHHYSKMFIGCANITFEVPIINATHIDPLEHIEFDDFDWNKSFEVAFSTK